MVGDHFSDKWRQLMPTFPQQGGAAGGFTLTPPKDFGPEIEQLRKEVLEMKELLRKAIDYDRRTGQAECHMEEKVAILKRVAELVGVSLEDVFKPTGGSDG